MSTSPSSQRHPAAAQPAKELSLRDRKKAETRQGIARATIEVILEQGVELATITTICERAGVSQRTFHNYFPHREAAVLHFLQLMMSWLCKEVEATEPGLQPLELAQSLAQRFYDNPDDPLLSMSAIGRLVSVIHGLDLEVLEELMTQDAREAATDEPEQLHARQRFLVPLVGAVRTYFHDRIDLLSATMLVEALLMVCMSVWELSQDPLLSHGRSAEDMVRDSFRLLQSGFSLTDAT